MAATQNRDMGSGSIPKLLAQLALPAVVAQMVNLLYNIVDRIYIGHMPEVGASALTGVGLFTPILMLITAFAMLCGSGGAPRAAIAMGRGDDDAAEKIMGNCFTLLLILAVLWALREKPMLRSMAGAMAALVCSVGSLFYMASPMGFLAVHFYNGEKGTDNRTVSYLAYPVLLLAVWAVGVLMF